MSWIARYIPLAFVMILLISLTGPLMQTSLSGGLGNRYAVASIHSANEAAALEWKLVDTNVRATDIAAELPYILIAWSLLGLLALRLAAKWQGRSIGLVFIASIAALGASTSLAYGLPAQSWLLVSGLAMAVGILLLFKQVGTTEQSCALQIPPQNMHFHTAWVWAMWLFLTGMGVLWQMDLAARGPQTLRSIGVRQLDALWAASFLVMPFMVWAHRQLLTALMGLRMAWHTERGPWVMVFGLMLMIAFCVWLGRYAQFGGHSGYPHLSAEIVRLSTGLLLAWLMSRYAEWGAARSRLAAASLLLSALLISGLVSLVLTGDLGPVLGLSVAILPMVLTVMVTRKGGKTLVISLIIMVIIWLSSLWLMREALMTWLPQLPGIPDRLVYRAEAALHPSSAQLDYASQILWLLEAAGPRGFGLGAVPWCGASADLGLSACTAFSGVPVPFGSDYVFSGVAAVWGIWASIALTVVTVFYFAAVGLLGLGRVNQIQHHGSAAANRLLQSWISATFAALAIGQLVVSVAGNLRVIPLSGVTQPLLGLGSASLVAMAAWIGFALGGQSSRPANGESKSPRQATRIQRYALTVAIGAVLFLGGMLVMGMQGQSAISDRLIAARVSHGLSILACATDTPYRTQHCEVAKEQLNTSEGTKARCHSIESRYLDSLSQLEAKTGLSFQRQSLTCDQMTSALSALQWTVSRTPLGIRKIIEVSVGELPGQISVSNPYRVEGCVLIENEERLGVWHDKRTQTLCNGGARRMDQILPHVPVLDQMLRAHTGRARKDGDVHETAIATLHAHASISQIPAPDWAELVGLPALVRPLAAQVALRQTRLGQGHDVELSIKGDIQHASQQVLDCYTGAPCKDCPDCQLTGSTMFEGARARMLGTLVVDIATTGIDAAASAHTPCYEAQHRGKNRSGCLQLPEPPRPREWMLNNHALYTEAMVGSLDKVPMALGQIRAGSPLGKEEEVMSIALSHSDTEKFIDNAMCLDRDFDPACIQSRLSQMVEAGHDLGWRSYCPAGKEKCGQIDLLSGLGSPLAHNVRAARWMTSAKFSDRSLVQVAKPGEKSFTQKAVEKCYAGGVKLRWRGCKGEGLVATVAEIFGQGNATSTPVGIALGMLRLARMAQPSNIGVSSLSPTLISRAGTPNSAPANTKDQEAANSILNALVRTPQPGGTAHMACERVQRNMHTVTTGGDVMHHIDCGKDGEWVIAGKTGTPLFPHDTLTHQQRLKTCRAIEKKQDSVKKNHELFHCQASPIKWFAAVLGKKDHEKIIWKKVVVVIAERNWSATTGLIDTPLDRGGNVAAEVAMQTAYRLINNRP